MSYAYSLIMCMLINWFDNSYQGKNGWFRISERDVGELEGAKGQSVVDADLENLAPLCLMWCQYKERNARRFEDCETSLINLKKLVIQTLFMGK
jgi:hypothetical protein